MHMTGMKRKTVGIQAGSRLITRSSARALDRMRVVLSRVFLRPIHALHKSRLPLGSTYVLEMIL